MLGFETDLQRYRDRILLLATVPQQLTDPSSLDKEGRQPGRLQVESLRIDRGLITVVGTSRSKNPHAFSEAMP